MLRGPVEDRLAAPTLSRKSSSRRTCFSARWPMPVLTAFTASVRPPLSLIRGLSEVRSGGAAIRQMRRPSSAIGILSSPECGIVARMDANAEPDLDDPFEEAIEEALSSLPNDLRAEVSNVAILVEDEPPDGRLLGRYSGVPRSLRGSVFGAGGMLPAKVCIFRGPITRLAAGDAERLRREVRNVVLRELAHYFAVT